MLTTDPEISPGFYITQADKRLRVRRLAGGLLLVIDPSTLYWGLASNEQGLRKIVSSYCDGVRETLLENLSAQARSHGPDTFELHPTEACNFACHYCYNAPNRHNPKTMSQHEMSLIVEKIIAYMSSRENCVPDICFHGGEPLLCKEGVFATIASYREKVKFNIQTNGSLLTAADIEFLEQHEVSVGISVDGRDDYNDQTRRLATGGGTFRLVEPALRMLGKYRRTGVIYTITKENANHIVDFIEYAFALGIRSIVVNPVSPERGCARHHVPPSDTLIGNVKRAIQCVIRLNRDHPADRISLDNIEAYVLAMLSDRQSSLCRMSPCGAGRFILVIASTGDVYPCSGYIGREGWAMGNIFEQELSDIADSCVSRQLAERRAENISGCSDCGYQQICGANCPVALLELYGSDRMASCFCDYHRGIMDYLLELLSEDWRQIFWLVSADEIGSLVSKKVVYRL